MWVQYVSMQKYVCFVLNQFGHKSNDEKIGFNKTLSEKNMAICSARSIKMHVITNLGAKMV